VRMKVKNHKSWADVLGVQTKMRAHYTDPLSLFEMTHSEKTS
jgi:hypothetical protein